MDGDIRLVKGNNVEDILEVTLDINCSLKGIVQVYVSSVSVFPLNLSYTSHSNKDMQLLLFC